MPLKPPIPPMEATSVDAIPVGPEWQYEPKWDGFRCLVFRDGDHVELQSKAGKPLTRYFPDVVASAKALPGKEFVLDGEIVVQRGRAFSLDDLLQRRLRGRRLWLRHEQQAGRLAAARPL